MVHKFEDFLNESRFVDLIDKKFTGEIRKEDIKHTYYKPVVFKGDGIHINYYVPEELSYLYVFKSIEDCKKWLKDHNYDIKVFNIEEYDEDYIDSNKMIIVDSEGDPIE
jgi:hypothetical protein